MSRIHPPSAAQDSPGLSLTADILFRQEPDEEQEEEEEDNNRKEDEEDDQDGYSE